MIYFYKKETFYFMKQADSFSRDKEVITSGNDGWGTFPAEDKMEICKMIRDRALGKISDEVWRQFYNLLENAAKAAPLESSGVIIVKTRVK